MTKGYSWHVTVGNYLAHQEDSLRQWVSSTVTRQFQACARINPSASVSRLSLKPTHFSNQWVPGVLSGGKARPGRNADHSPHLVPRPRMSRSYTSPPPWCLHGVARQLYFTYMHACKARRFSFSSCGHNELFPAALQATRKYLQRTGGQYQKQHRIISIWMQQP
jgi:hypothetical protein